MKIRAFSRRRVLTGAAAVSAAAILPRSSYGSDWRPTETVRLIVPAAAGGSTDVMGRLLAAHLQTAWGQSAVVENRSGGGGTIGTAEVVRGKADGHVILVGNPGPNAIAYSIFRNMTYKADQLQPVSNMIRIPNIVSAHPSTGIKSIPELIAYIKANPDKLTYGSSGVGQSPHLTGAWFLQLTGLKMVHVPFRGAGPALQAALAGDIQILFDNLYPSLPQTQDGKLTALCVTTPERTPAAPNIPTMREGAPELSNFDVSSWFGESSCQRPRPLPPSRRSTRRSRRCWRATTSRPPSARWAQLATGARRSNSPISCRRKPQIRRDHQARRPADGRELRGFPCSGQDDLLIFLTLASVASMTKPVPGSPWTAVRWPPSGPATWRRGAHNSGQMRATLIDLHVVRAVSRLRSTAEELHLPRKTPRLAPRGFLLISFSPLSAPGSPAATAPRCW